MAAAAERRALDLIVRAGVAHTVHEYTPPERHGRDRDRRPSYGADAAEALGIDPARGSKDARRVASTAGSCWPSSRSIASST